MIFANYLCNFHREIENTNFRALSRHQTIITGRSYVIGRWLITSQNSYWDIKRTSLGNQILTWKSPVKTWTVHGTLYIGRKLLTIIWIQGLFKVHDSPKIQVLGSLISRKLRLRECKTPKRWRPFELSSTVLCNNDRNRKLRFRVYDYDDDGSWVISMTHYDFNWVIWLL